MKTTRDFLEHTLDDDGECPSGCDVYEGVCDATPPKELQARHFAEVLAAALQEVTNVEELEALPIGTVIMPLAYHSATPVLVRDQWGTWAVAGHPSPYSTEVVFLGLHGEPARVLYRPSEQP